MDYTIAMVEQPYNMSFTAGGLLYHESLTVAALYDSLGAWDAVHARVIQDNLLKMRTHSAAQRIYREVASRLKNLTESQKALLLTGSHQEQGHMLWLAVCKRYRFIHDFATDVVREKFLRLDLALSYDDYDTFFNTGDGIRFAAIPTKNPWTSTANGTWPPKASKLAHSTPMFAAQKPTAPASASAPRRGWRM